MLSRGRLVIKQQREGQELSEVRLVLGSHFVWVWP